MLKENVPTLVAAVLCARGLETREQATAFLSWHPKLLCDPMAMRDMDKAVARIRRGIEQKEKIAVYGDYDVDGITSTCLLTQYLKEAGADVRYYIPCRMDEGYGVNREAIDSLRQEGITLIITVDCGITAVDEVRYAAGCGIEMVITDHHTCKDELPEAVAVVNPHRPDCEYPFKDLAGVGVALKLAMAIEGPQGARAVLEQYCDLAAIGTVADVMVLLGENRALVHMGLEALKKGARPGLAALLEESGTAPQTINSTTVGFCLAPRINAAGRMGKAAMAAELILTEDLPKARTLSHSLCELNRERQGVELTIFNECVGRLAEQGRHDSIVLADEDWHQGVVGIVASRLSERYACPAFMICLQDGKGKGSCRSYGGFNLFKALERCEDLLEGYGGHAMAAGFTILEENIPAFRTRMDELVRQDTGGQEQISTLEVDVDIVDARNLTTQQVEKLALLEPYGNGNAKPVFSLLGATVTCLTEVGGGRHLKLRVTRDGRTLDTIFFSCTRAQAGLRVGDAVDLAFFPQINEYRGARNVQLHLVDLRPSEIETAAQTEQGLYERLCQGQVLPQSEAGKILPERAEFVALWRYLESRGSVAEETPDSMAQNLSRIVSRQESAAKVLLCLDVLAECGLVRMERRDNRLRVVSRKGGGQKVDLEQAPLMRRLRKMAGE